MSAMSIEKKQLQKNMDQAVETTKKVVRRWSEAIPHLFIFREDAEDEPWVLDSAPGEEAEPMQYKVEAVACKPFEDEAAWLSMVNQAKDFANKPDVVAVGFILDTMCDIQPLQSYQPTNVPKDESDMPNATRALYCGIYSKYDPEISHRVVDYELLGELDEAIPDKDGYESLYQKHKVIFTAKPWDSKKTRLAVSFPNPFLEL